MMTVRLNGRARESKVMLPMCSQFSGLRTRRFLTGSYPAKHPQAAGIRWKVAADDGRRCSSPRREPAECPHAIWTARVLALQHAVTGNSVPQTQNSRQLPRAAQGHCEYGAPTTPPACRRPRVQRRLYWHPQEPAVANEDSIALVTKEPSTRGTRHWVPQALPPR